jgi:pimeloyl-ACP methyl ester carboxylesterase
MKTYVLAHGAWHGGWCWERVAARLQGHRAFAPSYTGMAEHAHQLSADITMATWVQDLVTLIEAEDLRDVILVGHSLGGVPITGVADRIPERIRRLVYLDGVVLESGVSAFDTYPPQEVQSRVAAAIGGVAVAPPSPLPPAWGLATGTPDYAWVAANLTPMPLNIYRTALTLKTPVGAGLPRTYIHCTEPQSPVIAPSAALVKSWQGWDWIDFAGPHDAMITHPDAIADLLLAL